MADNDLRFSKQVGILTLGMSGLVAVAIILGAWLNYHTYKSVLLDLTQTRLQIIATDLQRHARNTFSPGLRFDDLIDRLLKANPQIQSIDLFRISEDAVVPEGRSSRDQAVTPLIADGTMIVEIRFARDADQILSVALHYSLENEHLLLAAKGKSLLTRSLIGFVILSSLSWLGISRILHPSRSFGRWMTDDFRALMNAGKTPSHAPSTPCQEETGYLEFRKQAIAVLGVLKEAEDYGLTDGPESGEQV